MNKARNGFSFTFALLLALTLAPRDGFAQRIRDIARVKGIRPQHLTGIGLVIGLAGSGDSQQSELKKKFFANLIRNMGASMELTAKDLRSRNTALVIVSATVPSTLKVGSEFDVTVSSLGDASSLRGGHLLAVPLRGPSAINPDPADGFVPYYAVAQGDVFVEKEGEAKVTLGRSHAVLERAIDDVPFTTDIDSITILLLEPDFSTAARIVSRINRYELFQEVGNGSVAAPLALAVDSGTVRVRIPNHFLREDRVVEFISRILEIEIPEVSGEALISINRQSGAVVINGAVRVSTAAVVTYKGAMIRIPEARPPAPGEEKIFDRNPLLIDVVQDLKQYDFEARDIANILREMHRTKAILGRFVEW